MSEPPTAGINRLSLTENMPGGASTRGVRPGRRGASESGSEDDGPRPRHESDGSEDDGNDSDESDNEDASSTPTTISSPTRLKYDLRKLPEHSRDVARQLFRDISREPGHLAVQWCQLSANSAGTTERYAFQLHEVVHHSVRIGRAESEYAEPTCTCEETKPCRHLLFLHDQITKQALYDHDPDEPLTMNEEGFAEELGSPFSQIAKLHLAVLAGGLGCDAWSSDQNPVPSQARIQAAQDVVSYFTRHDDYDDNALTDYIGSVNWLRRSLVRRDNLEITMFNLLVKDPNLAAWLRSLLDQTEQPFDPYTQLERRIERIIAEIDKSEDDDTSPTEEPRDADWATGHILRTASAIRKTLIRSTSPPEPWERASAARAIVHILRMVVTNPRLYFRIVGDADERGFPLEVLELLVDQSQWREELEDISNEMGMLGLRPAYKRKMDGILARLRSSGSSRRASGAASVSGSVSASGSGAGPSGYAGGRASSGSRASAAGTKRQGHHGSKHERSGKRSRPT